MFRMPKFGNPGQVEDGCSPQQKHHHVHPVILSKVVRSGPVIPSKPTESWACPVFGSLTRQRLNRAAEPIVGLTGWRNVVAWRSMKLKWILSVVAAVAAVCLTGCVGDLAGQRHFGIPLTKDTVEGRYEFTPIQLWTAAKDVLNHQGTLTGEDMQRNVLDANVDERRIWVKIDELDNKISRVLVQARTKGGAPDMEMAAFIDKQIAVRLASGNLTPAQPKR